MQTIHRKGRAKRLKLPPDCIVWVRAFLRVLAKNAHKGHESAVATRRRTNGELGNGQVDYWAGLIKALRWIDSRIGETIDPREFARAMVEVLDCDKEAATQRE